MTRAILTFLTRINKSHRPFFYRDKRVLLSFILSLPIAYFFGLFAGVLTHLASGVFWDIWFFSYKRVKESDITPQEWFDYTGMTREQLDQHSKAFMWLRHGAFLISLGVATVFFDFNNWSNFNDAFLFALIGYRAFTFFYIIGDRIVYPWLWAEVQICMFKKDIEWQTTVTSNTAPNPYELSNTMGYINPISPNYIYRDN